MKLKKKGNVEEFLELRDEHIHTSVVLLLVTSYLFRSVLNRIDHSKTVEEEQDEK